MLNIDNILGLTSDPRTNNIILFYHHTWILIVIILVYLRLLLWLPKYVKRYPPADLSPYLLFYNTFILGLCVIGILMAVNEIFTESNQVQFSCESFENRNFDPMSYFIVIVVTGLAVFVRMSCGRAQVRDVSCNYRAGIKKRKIRRMEVDHSRRKK